MLERMSGRCVEGGVKNPRTRTQLRTISRIVGSSSATALIKLNMSFSKWGTASTSACTNKTCSKPAAALRFLTVQSPSSFRVVPISCGRALMSSFWAPGVGRSVKSLTRARVCVCVSECVYMCGRVCVCVCEKERAKERIERAHHSAGPQC